MTIGPDSRPLLKAPPGSCDTHIHFYDKAYPPSPDAWLFPPNFTVADYRMVQRRLGLERVVVVQPVTYGFDNSCTLDAVAQIGANARAVVIVPESITDRELSDLWGRGARGLRFHQMRGGMTRWADLPIMAERLAGTGWHIQLQCDGLELPQREELIASLPCMVVIDHTGRFREPLPLDHPAVRSLFRLAAFDHVHVKLSGAYHMSQTGAPGYEDVAPLAKGLVALDHRRLLWASDWPHPTHIDAAMPDDAGLLDLLLSWVPDEDIRHAILAGNPARLYGFSE